MVDIAITFEEVLHEVDQAIKPAYLNKIQEIILEQTWEGKTYSEIASNYSYEFEYIKGAGCDLWKLLSKSFDRQISKSNFVQFMRRQVGLNQYDPEVVTNFATFDKVFVSTQLNPWTTAPDVSNSNACQKDMACLEKWSEDSRCRFILVTGMVGCGKTTLVTKYAKKQQNNFDAVIWFSLQNSPKVESLLKSCLQLLNNQLNLNPIPLPDDFDSLLNLLIFYLGQHRCLLVFDSLRSIIEVGTTAIYYRKGHERYGQLLRCIITASHNSLLVATSRVKPKLFSFYNREQVKFLNLQGLKSAELNKIFQPRLNQDLSPATFQSIWEYYMYNPQMLNIFVANMERLKDFHIDDFLQHAPVIEEIDYLLGKEIDYLSNIEKQIIHWLAIDCATNTVETISRKIGEFISKPKLIEALHNLEGRSLISYREGYYKPAPLVQDYLQRRLVRLSIPKLAG